MVRVLVVSEVRLYREGLAQNLDDAEGITVVGTARELEDAVRLIQGLRPELVLLDMARTDGLELVRTIATLAPEVKIVALALPEDDSHVIAGAEAGIAGYVPREASLAELVVTVQRVADGEMPCSGRVAAALAHRLASIAAERSLADPMRQLTFREREVLDLIGEGLSNKEIAQRLCIEVPTVKNHVHNILEKMGVRRRARAAALGRAHTLT